ncbi:MAG: DUF86 domain-containing protein [Nanoarchaeota archaeon]|nr:DUF86 domain-containing protein [Nanoarchaeota archaeon]
MKEDKIRDKIIEIETYLEQLESILPSDLEEYKTNFKIKLMGERSFEKIVEAVEDIAFMMVKERNLKQPEYEKQVFDILANSGIISIQLSKKLKDAKGMRNIISHQYSEINDELVFNSLIEELIPDVQEFIKQINNIN